MIRNIPVVDDNNSRSDLFSRLLKDRIILLTGEVNDEMADLVVAQLLYLDAEDEKDITLYINSPGGSVTQGLAIYDTMKLLKSDISTVCIGMAASMGSFLLAGGTKGKRKITQNAEVMIHQPSGGSQGQQSDIEIQAEHIKRTRTRLENLYSQFTGKPASEINLDCNRDNYMTAEEAKAYGLVDEIIE